MTATETARTAYLHRAAKSDRAADDRARRTTMADSLDCIELAATLESEAAALWEARWVYSYGRLEGPLSGAASRKPVSARIGLIVVALAAVLNALQPHGAGWAIDYRAHLDDSPRSMLMTRADTDDRRAALLRLDVRTIRIGDHGLALASKTASRDLLRLLAAEAGAFFGEARRAH